MPDIVNITTVTEFATATESVTAMFDIRFHTGEGYMGPMIVGFCQDDADAELWIEKEGQRVQFPSYALPALVKQLRRAAKIAQEAHRA